MSTQKATLHDVTWVILKTFFWSIWFMKKAFLKLWRQKNRIGCLWHMLLWDLRNASCMLMLVMEHKFPNPSVKLSLILSQTAKCMQWNFHQNPSISSKSQRNLRLLNFCSPWRWPKVALWTRPGYVSFEPALPSTLRSDRRFTVPHDGEWWAIDRAQAAVTYTLALNTLQRKFSSVFDKSHQIIEK